MVRRWKVRPEGSTWGDFGEDDFLGRLNLITPEKVRQGAGEVSEGLSFSLSLPLDLPGGSSLNKNRRPPIIRPNLRFGHVNFNFELSSIRPGGTDLLNDDLVVMHLQYSTQWDALSHYGSRFDTEGDGQLRSVYYNGYAAGVDVVGPSNPADADVPEQGAGSTSSGGPISVAALAQHGIQGRGILINLRKHLGDARQAVTYRTLERILETDSIQIEPGDIVLFYTGFSTQILRMDGDPDVEFLSTFGAELDGRDPELLQWITDTEIAAIATDNYGVELSPNFDNVDEKSLMPLHVHCLFRLGAPLGELWYLEELAEALEGRGRRRFQLTAPPLRLPGAVGSPVTPIATI